ncbi:ATP12 family chaperone protein [Ensifer soli]|uniref:ATP12 family chaperone protein n=1 Tax=Ciceribacter sp. sgz301302 TaxID=3342379 RepID=UPI0035B95CE1
MPDHREDLTSALTDSDPVRRAQIQMLKPLPKRFYAEASVGEAEGGGYRVLLDGKTVRTPAGTPFAVPVRALADLLANEWNAQLDVIDPARMPATRIVNTALDGVAKDVRSVFDDILKFAGTDLVCYRAEAPEGLVQRQNAFWNPVLRFAENRFGARFLVTEGIVHQAQPPEAIAAFAEALRSYATPLGLACLHTITTLTGSALLALAYAEGRLDAGQIWKAAHVDEDWQAEHWGVDAEAAERREARWIELETATRVLETLR